MTRGRTLAALFGVAALLIGIVLLAAVAGAFAVSRCDDGGEARTGELALRTDPVTNQARGTTVPRARRPGRPVRVEIPSIGVDASIVPLGLNTDRTLQVPSDFGDAGWWTGGPRPGEPGPAIIAGHVDSYTGPAIFFRLGELGRGAEIVVVRRDGTRARFRGWAASSTPRTSSRPSASMGARRTRRCG